MNDITTLREIMAELRRARDPSARQGIRTARLMDLADIVERHVDAMEIGLQVLGVSAKQYDYWKLERDIYGEGGEWYAVHDGVRGKPAMTPLAALYVLDSGDADAI